MIELPRGVTRNTDIGTTQDNSVTFTEVFDLSALRTASRIAIQGQLSTGDVDPEDIDAVAAIWPPLTVGETVRQGDLRYHRESGKLLRAAQPTYTVRAEDDPLAVPAIWTVLGTPLPGGELPAWRQPLGSHDAYRMGDKVIHNGGVWEVTQTDASGNNVWEPGVFGWTRIGDA